MSEHLIIHLPLLEDKPIRWLVWSEELQQPLDEGKLNNLAELSQISGFQDNRSVRVLISGHVISIWNSDLPPGAQKQASKVLPAMLEEYLTDDIESLHFAILDSQQENVTTAVIKRSIMDGILNGLKDANLVPDVLQPDWLALPYQDGATSAACIDNMWLIKNGKYLGCSVCEALLPLILHSVDGIPQPVHSTDPAPVSELSSVWQISSPAIPVMHLLSVGSVKTPLSLLTGCYRTEKKLRTYWPKYRSVLCSLGLLLLVFLVGKGITLGVVTHFAGLSEQKVEQQFRELFPQQSRIVNVQTQFKANLKKMKREVKGAEMMEMLSRVSGALTTDKGKTPVSIYRMKFDQDRQELQLQLKAQDFARFERLRNDLSRHFSVQQSALSRQDNYISGSITLKDKAA